MSFAFPIDASKLQNARVRLEPFDPDAHIAPYWAALAVRPDLNDYMPWPRAVEASPEALRAWYERTFTPADRTRTLFATVDVASGAFAGAIGLLHAAPENESVEIGYVTVVPRFQRTHVNTNAVGLLLFYLLDELKLRRVQWQAHEANAASVRAAERLGFKREGVMRWQRVWPIERGGIRKPGAADERGGVHSVVLSLCWDDWETPGFTERMRAKMGRTV